MLMTYSRRRHRTRSQEPGARYRAPTVVRTIWLRDALAQTGRGKLSERQLEFFRSKSEGQVQDVELFYAGDIGLLKCSCVSIVGTREATFEGESRASRLARELVTADVVIMSGLARGIDAAAHRSAIQQGGRTIAVIGTPLSRAYPVGHASLQTEIWKEHLLVSPFREDASIKPGNFPRRNRVMAALSDATVIIEAAEGSGTLHQAAECQRLKRWLFIARAVVEDPKLEWPKRFIGHPYVAVLNSTADILSKLEERGDVG
jgi:DNA processing protein